MKLSTFMNATGRARLLAMLITLLLAFSVAACGDDDDDKGSSNNDTTDVVSEQDTTNDDQDTTNGDQDTTPDDQDTTPDDQDTTPDDQDTTPNDPDTTDPGVDTPAPDNSHLNDTNGTTCDDIFVCQNECEASDFECGDACVDAGSDRAKQERIDLLTCLDDKCAGLGQAALQACMNTYCRAISIACFGEPEPGVCLQTCTGPDDDSCRGENICQDRGAIICMAPDGNVPADAQDCTDTGTCDNPDENCYTFGGGGTPQPGAACIDNCEQDSDCPGELTCEQLSDTLNGCLLVQGEDIFIPADSEDCLDDASVCGDTQTCVNYGGGGNEGSGQTDCSLYPDTSATCTDPAENCYTVDQAGNTACYPFNPDAEVGDACASANACNDGQACLGSGTQFHCYELCDASATTDTCSGENSSCIALEGDLGYCQETIPANPDAEVGDACGPGIGGCADTQYCITFTDPNNPNSQESTCQTACSTSDGSLCTVAGESCQGVGGLETEALDGICLPTQGG